MQSQTCPGQSVSQLWRIAGRVRASGAKSLIHKQNNNYSLCAPSLMPGSTPYGALRRG
jgi:hypothetical protein